ncbi:hypothetical protein [Rubrivirga sp.]|uniref:hypothetical protein n=1 Tax=Rubrivirga sp. TaxID=1885344 RepID=UPI003B527DAE
MPDAARLPSRRDRHAVTRALASLAASLGLVVAAFVWWPDVDLGPDLPRSAPTREQVVFEMVEPTRQPPPSALPPAPPPAPTPSERPPVEVPDERLAEEIVRDIELPVVPAPRPSPRRSPAIGPPAPPAPGPPAPGPPAPSGPPPAADRIVERPDRSPRLSGQALPVYPRGASVSGFRGSARVRVLVNAGGRVTDAEIVQRVTFDRDREVAVAAFPPEFDAAVLEAARRHVFRPARDGGERVRAYAFISVSLDPPE